MSGRRLESPNPPTRNVYLYNDAGNIIGSINQYGSITNSNIYRMCGIFLHFEDPITSSQWQIYELTEEGATGPIVNRDGAALREGKYIVLGPGAASINVTSTETCSVRRVPSPSGDSSKMSKQQKHFRDTVRQRDLKCAITRTYLGDSEFIALEAAHIFPIAQEVTWNKNNYKNWVTDTSPTLQIGNNWIQSPQNGLLLKSDIHAAWIHYLFAIDPDDNYNIIWLGPWNYIGLDGTKLADRAINPADPNHRVSDHALRWNFEQAVLRHMKGATGEQWPYWEEDFGDGGDMIGEIMEGPDAAERMELELATRLGAGNAFSENDPDGNGSRDELEGTE